LSQVIGYAYYSDTEDSPVTKTLAFLTMLVVCSVAQNAHAASKKKISGSGCVEKAAKNSCRVVIDSQTGELYNLLFPARAPKASTAIKFTGTPHKGPTACVQGKAVTVSKWEKEKGIKCPPLTVTAEAGQ
jgi:hypothetical protein